MGLLIPKSFWFLTDWHEILSIQMQQFKTLDKTAARKRINREPNDLKLPISLYRSICVKMCRLRRFRKRFMTV